MSKALYWQHGIYTQGFRFDVSDGEDADASNFNSSFISRESNSGTVAKIDLQDSGSSDIIDVQSVINTNITNIANRLISPSTHADNKLLKTDGVDTKTMQESGISISDSDNVTGVNDLTVGNNLVVVGNLTIQGTTTQVDTTNMNVSDKNILINDGGNDASSEGAGITVERTGTDGSIVYEDSLATKFKIGALGSEVEVMDLSTTQTPTNKVIDGNNNTLTVLAATQLSGATPIANGGTGQAAKAAAFDALAPSTTKGDLIVFGASNNVRRAVGSNDQVLTADSAQADGVKWATPAAANGLDLNVESFTSNDTLDANNDLALCSGGPFTITLPTAVGITGKRYWIKKTDLPFATASAITIDGDGTETIDGKTTVTLNTKNEHYYIISDGANWQILEHRIPSVFIAYTPTFTGFGTATSIEFVWARKGDSLYVLGKFASGISTAVEARVTLPSGLTSEGSPKIASIRTAGYGSLSVTSASSTSALIEPSITHFTFGAQSAGNAGLTKLVGNGFLNDTNIFSFASSPIPIVGWEE